MTNIDYARSDNIDIFIVDKTGAHVGGSVPEASLGDVAWELDDSGNAALDLSSFDPAVAQMILMQREILIVFNNFININTGQAEAWWGLISDRDGSPGKASFKFEGVMSWLKKRMVDTGSLTYTSMDQFDIAWNLINTAQTGTNRALNFTSSYAPSGKIRSRTYPRDQHKNYYDLLKEFSTLRLLNGFDWEFVPDLAAGHRV
jgi:hypothetical protein